MLVLLHSAIDREEHEKYLFLPLYENTENPLVTACAPRIDTRRKGDYASFLVLFNILLNVFSKRIAC